MNNPLVSILTTVYNREKYLAECIESVLLSTFQDWEMIIVDDQSTDRSFEIAESYAAKDKRIKVYLNEANLGDYPNRNKAASHAKGTFIKYLDGDDLIYSHGLEIMVNTMKAFPEAVLGISQQVQEDLNSYPFLMEPKESFEREFLKRGVLKLGPTGTIFRRDVFEKLGGFTGTRYIGDTEMWYKMAMLYPVVKMVPGLVYWRQHDDQEITKGMESFFYLENAYLHAIETINHDDCPLSSRQKTQALEIIKKRFSRSLLRLMSHGKFKTANRIRKSCGVGWISLIKNA